MLKEPVASSAVIHKNHHCQGEPANTAQRLSTIVHYLFMITHMWETGIINICSTDKNIPITVL